MTVHLQDQFKAVLGSEREEDVQAFLTLHPEILLAAFGNHWNVNDCIPKFRFGSEYVSDFVIVTGQSFSYDVILIELEPPLDRPFTQNGKYAKRLNGAIGQINDWQSWIHDNDAYFRASLAKAMKNGYGASQISMGHRVGRERLFVTTKIIIGRRDMLSADDNKRRAAIYAQSNKATEIVPYDRLLEAQAKLQKS